MKTDNHDFDNIDYEGPIQHHTSSYRNPTHRPHPDNKPTPLETYGAVKLAEEVKKQSQPQQQYYSGGSTESGTGCLKMVAIPIGIIVGLVPWIIIFMWIFQGWEAVFDNGLRFLIIGFTCAVILFMEFAFAFKIIKALIERHRFNKNQKN